MIASENFMNKPQQKQEINLDELKAECQEYIDRLEKGMSIDLQKKYPHWIFEKAIKAIYGDDAIDWVIKVSTPDYLK